MKLPTGAKNINRKHEVENKQICSLQKLKLAYSTINAISITF
jgi:hypothetical protein